MKSKLLFLALIAFFTANAQYTGATPWEKRRAAAIAERGATPWAKRRAAAVTAERGATPPARAVRARRPPRRRPLGERTSLPRCSSQQRSAPPPAVLQRAQQPPPPPPPPRPRLRHPSSSPLHAPLERRILFTREWALASGRARARHLRASARA